MTTTKFQTKLLTQYVAEIFGNDNIKDPLLVKPISQKTKFQLKKLGNDLHAEYIAAMKQVNEIRNQLSEEYEEPLPPESKPDAVPTKGTRIKEDKKAEFLKLVGEIEEMEVEVSHADFTERDFFDQTTGDMVASRTYYNIIDVLIYEKQEATPA